MVDTIKIVGFEKDLALWAAETNGFFAAQDLIVAFTQTRNSTEEISGLLDGTWDIAFDNGDNVVAWDEGHGADGQPHDLFIFMGGGKELSQALYSTPNITEIRQLQGKILGVDAVATGYAVVLRYILQCHGLSSEKDYSLEPVGSTRMRLEKLLEGKVSGAMLNPLYAGAVGPTKLRQLARGKEYVDPYPSRVGIATHIWPKSHRASLVRFICAHLMAMDWILNAANKNTAMELLKSKMERSEKQAEEEYHKAVSPRGELAGKGALDPATLQTVLDLRVKTGIMPSPAPAAHKYYDASYYQAASAMIATAG
jgi:ABC-type nitrate/sulfonate/bicarbonate transport system substrate-binding protein